VVKIVRRNERKLEMVPARNPWKDFPVTSRRSCLAGALIFAVPIFFYACFLDRGFVYDDFIVIRGERPIAGPGDLLRIFREPHYAFRPYYRPVARLTYAAQATLHGVDDPLPYHLFNAVLAGCFALGAWRIYRLPGLGIDPVIAGPGALVLALHPVAASCVFPASSGRETLLPAALMMASLYLHLRGGARRRLLAWLLFTLALFSKESAVVLLPLFLVADVLRPTAGPAPSFRSLARRHLPMLASLIAYLGIRLTIFKGGEFRLQDGPLLFLATPVYAIQTCLLPFADPVYEPVRFSDWISPVRLAIASAVLLAGAVTALRRGFNWRVLGFWAGLFFLGMLPTANILVQDAPYCERYVLLPLVALVGLACGIASRGRRPRLAAAAGLVLLLVAAAVSARYASVFRTNLGFCEQWARTSPIHYLPHFNLGKAQEDANLLAEAERSYLRSISLDPALPSSHNNLGSIYLRTGRNEEALRAFRRSRELEPKGAKAHYGEGVALLQLEDYSSAIAALSRAIELDPRSAEAHHNLGVALAATGDLRGALGHFEAALRISPGKENSLRSRALVLRQLEGR
jgi:tetratricopeptide (TPR) repeat protein